MKLRMKSVTVWTISIILLAIINLPTIAQGQTVTVSGTVRNNNGEPFPDAEIQIINPDIPEDPVGSTTTDENGEYVLYIPPGTYNVKVIPPEGSGFGSSITLGQILNSDTILNFVLVPTGVVTLSGRVLDPLGEGISNQDVWLAPTSTDNWIISTTDDLGNYYFEVVPGEYTLKMENYTYYYEPAMNAASDYYLYSNESLSLSESMVMDIPLPEHKVDVHVQDPAGNPVEGVEITTNEVWNNELSIGSLSASGRSYYPYQSGYYHPITNTNGYAELWLFTSRDDRAYTITAAPPEESPFATFNVYDVEVYSDITEIIVLDFVHPAPVTTIDVNPAPNGKGVYPDPITVTLSATATEGFTIAGTYYSVDGGPLLVYSEPFVISGAGPHSIEYWSEDNIGVFELPKTLYITINSPPTADAGTEQILELESSSGTEATLDGSGSTDPDSTEGTNDDIVSFDWYEGAVHLGSEEILDYTFALGEHTVTLFVTDSFGRTDDAQVNIVIEDTTAPEVEIIIPEAGSALQDVVTLTAEASDVGGVAQVYFYIREAQNPDDSIGYEDLSPTYNSASDQWEYPFDTTQLPDDYYIILAMAVDNSGNEGWSEVIAYSIRNWAVIELLPASENNKAGRTIPVKFSLRIAASVDPEMPFVYNESLEIKIYDQAEPGTILHSSFFGTQSTDYRIGEHYITNFKTKKQPAVYVVEIWRTSNNFEVGSFTFETVK